jgi:two-component system nitrate/nitrite response regulator NarL
LLLDMRLPNLSGMDVLRELGPSSGTRAIVLAASLETNEVTEALQCSARGVVLKEAATESIFRSIDAVMAGQYWIYCTGVPSLEDALTGLSGREPVEKLRRYGFDLTKREYDVIKAIAAGCTNKEVANRLSISEQTIKHHVTNIFNKTGVSNRLELTLLAIEKKLVDLPPSPNPFGKIGHQTQINRDSIS